MYLYVYLNILNFVEIIDQRAKFIINSTIRSKDNNM